MSRTVDTAARLHKRGYHVLIAFSAARMVLDRVDGSLDDPRSRALAATYECQLIATWQQLFGLMRQSTALMNISKDDITDGDRLLGCQNTLFELLSLGTIPLIHGGETVGVDGAWKYGDMDVLSAVTAAVVQANHLVFISENSCLVNMEPRQTINSGEQGAAHRRDSAITVVNSKAVAARLASNLGTMTTITTSCNFVDIYEMMKTNEDAVMGQEWSKTSECPVTSVDFPFHTVFLPSSAPVQDRIELMLHGAWRKEVFP